MNTEKTWRALGIIEEMAKTSTDKQYADTFREIRAGILAEVIIGNPDEDPIGEVISWVGHAVTASRAHAESAGRMTWHYSSEDIEKYKKTYEAAGQVFDVLSIEFLG